jgi:hypothetical protein
MKDDCAMKIPKVILLGYFWVDVICIDQSNISERNVQLSRIAEIYEKSKKIVARLGLADHSAESTFAAITDLGNASERLLASKGGT